MISLLMGLGFGLPLEKEANSLSAALEPKSHHLRHINDDGHTFHVDNQQNFELAHDGKSND